MKDESSLNKVRQDIDKLDQQIIKLIQKRIKLVERIINYKAKNGMRAHQPKRFAEVIKSRRALAKKHSLDPDVIEAIWRVLIAHITHIEKKKIKQQTTKQN